MNMSWFSFTCRRHYEEISLLAAGSLPEDAQRALATHLADCPSCRQRFSELKSLIGDLRTWKADQNPNQPPDNFQFMLRRALRDTAQDGAADHHSSSPKDWRKKRLVLAYLATIWLLTLFFNADAPRTTEQFQVARPVSTKQIYMALKATHNFSWHQSAREVLVQPATPPPPHSRRRSFDGEYPAV